MWAFKTLNECNKLFLYMNIKIIKSFFKLTDNMSDQEQQMEDKVKLFCNVFSMECLTFL